MSPLLKERAPYFARNALVPAEYVPGLRFTDVVPAVLILGAKYVIRGNLGTRRRLCAGLGAGVGRARGGRRDN